MRLILLVLLFAFAGQPAHAQQTDTAASMGIKTEARLGYEFDRFEAVAVGVGARVDTPELLVRLNPTFDVYFSDVATLFQLSLNALYPISVEDQPFAPYVGGGLGLTQAEVNDSDADETELSLNLIAGATFPVQLQRLTPFAQLQITVAGVSDLFALTAGLLFDV